MQIWALIVDGFREARDRKLFWAMIVISVLIAAGMACVGFDDRGMSILFGVWRVDDPAFTAGADAARAVVGAVLTKYIAGLYIGWVGIIMALIATAGAFPSMMERGAVEVLLAKPLSRPKLFVGKYLAGLVFVAVQATVFVVLTLLVVGLRWGYWFPGYLWSIPLIVVLFSYLYGFSVLFAVLTRSTTTALLLTMVAWIGVWVPQTTYALLVSFSSLSAPVSPAPSGSAPPSPWQIDEKWVRLASAARWVVPKTKDIPLIAGNLIGASTATEVVLDPGNPDLPEPDRRQAAASVEVERRLSDISIFESIGSSLCFEAVVVLLAMWKFTRRDF